LTEPSRHQRTVLISLALLADHIVVMTQTAYDRLATIYPIDMKKVTLIPHGATPPVGAETRNDIPPQLLTWGLLGPGKGIEHVIDALALLKDMDPQPRYTISGVTHPKVLAHSGDIYRESLIRRAHEQGVDHLVTFDDTYRTVHELTAFVASSTVVILPYDSRDQITSGVLVDAIVAGCPVIATTFPHATELLSDGAGILVPHGNPPAIAAAIRTLLTDAHALHVMRKEVAQIAVTHTWEDVSYRYSLLAMSLLATTPSTHAAPSRTAKDTAYSYAAVKKGQRP
jgi:glycosyltransferase involved in cell wall biosynthesis